MDLNSAFRSEDTEALERYRGNDKHVVQTSHNDKHVVQTSHNDSSVCYVTHHHFTRQTLVHNRIISDETVATNNKKVLKLGSARC